MKWNVAFKMFGGGATAPNKKTGSSLFDVPPTHRNRERVSSQEPKLEWPAMAEQFLSRVLLKPD